MFYVWMYRLEDGDLIRAALHYRRYETQEEAMAALVDHKVSFQAREEHWVLCLEIIEPVLTL